MTCPNHPAGRTCPACDPPAAPINAAWLGKFLLLFIPAFLVCAVCPILLIIPVGIMLLHGIIKSAVVAAVKEARKP